MKKKECPSCAMEVDRKADKCPICGYEFADYPNSYKWVAILLIVIFILYLIF